MCLKENSSMGFTHRLIWSTTGGFKMLTCWRSTSFRPGRRPVWKRSMSRPSSWRWRENPTVSLHYLQVPVKHQFGGHISYTIFYISCMITHCVLCLLVRSTFMQCVDNRLLKSNNLICPQDYITEQVPFVKAPQGNATLTYIYIYTHTGYRPWENFFNVSKI